MKHALMIWIGFTLSGCAIFGSAPDTRSVALRVALHTGITDEDDGPLRDVSRADIEAARIAMSDKDMNRMSKDAGPIKLSVSARSLTSGNPTGAIVTWLVGEALLGAISREHPATRPHLIAYIPQELADGDEDVAHELMNKTLTNGVAQVLSRKYTVKKVEATEKRTFSRDIRKTFLVLTGGPICGTKVMCSFEPYAIDEVQEEDEAPEIIPQSEDGYFVWRNWKPGDYGKSNTATMISSYRIQPIGSQAGDLKTYFTGADYEKWRVLDPIFSRDYLRELTAVMPEWFYIYVGVDGPTLPPAFFHRGQQLDFIGG